MGFFILFSLLFAAVFVFYELIKQQLPGRVRLMKADFEKTGLMDKGQLRYAVSA
jgi:hypothetical protein